MDKTKRGKKVNETGHARIITLTTKVNKLERAEIARAVEEFGKPLSEMIRSFVLSYIKEKHEQQH